MENQRKTHLSKTMSYFLRHNLDAFNKVNIDGSVEIKELLALPEFSDVDIAELLYIVATNEKQRFKISEDGLYIRANQGHSISEFTNLIDAEQIFKQITEPLEYCAHGTTSKSLKQIMTNGLNRMNRTYIHFASAPNAKSGFRKSSDVLIHIDMPKAMSDGIKFYMSDNGVILSDGIDGIIESKYFSKIE